MTRGDTSEPAPGLGLAPGSADLCRQGSARPSPAARVTAAEPRVIPSGPGCRSWCLSSGAEGGRGVGLLRLSSRSSRFRLGLRRWASSPVLPSTTGSPAARGELLRILRGSICTFPLAEAGTISPAWPQPPYLRGQPLSRAQAWQRRLSSDSVSELDAAWCSWCWRKSLSERSLPALEA